MPKASWAYSDQDDFLWTLKHTLDKNGSNGPAFLWQKFYQNIFEHQNCSRTHIRGCKWVK